MDVLLYEIDVTPHELGTATVTISEPHAATTDGAPDGAMFASAVIDPNHPSATFEVVPSPDCASSPEPDPYHPDSDGDGVPDVCDRCPGFDDAVDGDGDGIADGCDNCPGDENPDQLDLDVDSVGDVCDPDRDGDRVANETDNCPDAANADQLDIDHDTIGDACDPRRNLSIFDYDSDEDVDMMDFAVLQRCFVPDIRRRPH
jgi:hypothetical protein